MKASRDDLLKRIYEYDQDVGGPLQIPFKDEQTGEYRADLSTLRADVNHLEQIGYVFEPISLAMCYNLSLTEKGEEYVENHFQRSPQHAPSFNFAGATINNAVIGNDVSGNTISFSSSAALAELEALIQNRPPEDQALLKELLAVLREIQSPDKPVEKGKLSRFYEVVKKGSDLLLPRDTFPTVTLSGGTVLPLHHVCPFP